MEPVPVRLRPFNGPYSPEGEAVELGDCWWYTDDDGDGQGPPMQFCWRCVWCGEVHRVPVISLRGGRPAWTWDGNRERPSLQPSIRVLNAHDRLHPCTWHGYVTAGALVTLGDSGTRPLGAWIAPVAAVVAPYDAHGLTAAPPTETRTASQVSADMARADHVAAMRRAGLYVPPRPR